METDPFDDLDDEAEADDLDHRLAAMLSLYETDREDQWRGKREGADWDTERGMFGFAERLAEAIAKAVTSLTVARSESVPESATYVLELRQLLESAEESVSWPQNIANYIRSSFPPREAKRILDDLTKQAQQESIDQMRPSGQSLLRLVWERLMIKVAWQLIGNHLPRAANRMLQLSQWLIEAEPTEATSSFLCRVSAAYLMGCDVDCAAACRGALDTAFKAAITDTDLQRWGYEPQARYGYTMQQRIDAARDRNLIGNDEYDAAREVSRHGNSAVHDGTTRLSASQLIQLTLQVIRALLPGMQGGARERL